MRIFIVLAITFVLSLTISANPKPLAENFTATTLAGKNISLEDYRGKVVVLTFWSPTCAICHEEIPKLNVLAQKYRGGDVIFLGVTNADETRAGTFLKKKPFDFEIIPNGFGVLLKYADRDREGNLNIGFPAHFVINQKGEVEYKASGFDKTAALDSLINRLLAAK